MITALFHRTLSYAIWDRKITLRRLEEVTDIPNSRLSRLQRGHTTPSTEERVILARIFPKVASKLLHSYSRPDNFGHEMLAAGQRFWPRQEVFYPPADRPSRVRFKAATRSFASECSVLEYLLAQREDLQKIDFFCDQLSLGSSLECLKIMTLFAQGAVPAYLEPVLAPSPLPHPLVCPRTRKYVGNRPLPCLQLSSQIWYPQVSVSTPQVFTLDFLVHDSTSAWSVLEIDGAGHVKRDDEERTLALGIPVVRVSEQEVLREIRGL